MHSNNSHSMSIEKIPFAGGEIHALNRNGVIYVSLKKVCEELGVDIEGQRKKLRDLALQGEVWAGAVIISAPSAGGEQQMTMLPADSLPMFLVRIQVSKVKEEIRPKLLQYKNEAAVVLNNYFRKKESSPSHDLKAQIAVMCNQLQQSSYQLQQSNLVVANILMHLNEHEEKINTHEEKIELLESRPPIKEIQRIKPKNAAIAELKKTFHACLSSQNRIKQQMPLEEMQRDLCQRFGKRDGWDQTKYQIACNYLKKHYQFDMSDVEDLFVR